MVSQMRKLLERALSETFTFHGGWGWWVGIIAVQPVFFVLRYAGSGLDGVLPELYGWVEYLLAATIVFISIFVINLCRAPLLLERDDHNATKTELESVKLTLPNGTKPRLLDRVQQIRLAETIRSATKKPDKIMVYYQNTDPECEDFAVSISDAFQLAGIEAPVKINPNGTWPRARGIRIGYDEASDWQGLASAISNDLKRWVDGVQIAPEPKDRNFPLFLSVHRQE